MADSDNRRTLPSVTRRRLMAGAASAGAAWPFGGSARGDILGMESRDDPALCSCEKWQEARNNTLALCRKQQSLEAHLVRTIGFPDVRLINGSEPAIRFIDGLPERSLLEDEAVRHRAVVDLAAHQARWDAMDEQIGYSRMDRIIRESEATEQAILSDLLLSPALTIHGVLAKLSVILCEAENREGRDDFPWPHIRALRHDLIRLHGLDIATIPSSEKPQNSQSR
jgi:hypothetical protein